MQGKLPLNKNGASIEDIVKQLPKEPYLAVFGTSHSSGCCEKNGYSHINHDDIWCSILAKRRGLKVVNFSIAGNDNVQMLNQLTQFLDLEKKYLQNCKMIIAESRVGDYAGKFPVDVFTDYKEPIEQSGLELGGGYDFRYRTIDNAIYRHFALGKDTKEYFKKMIASCQPDWQPHDISPAKYNMLKDIVRIHTLGKVASETNFYLDYASINTMRVMSKNSNIPFYWFCWDKKGKNMDHTRISEFYNTYTNLFEAQILYPNLKEVIHSEVNREFDVTNQCDCNHNNEIVHSWVADRIYNELRDKDNDR